MKKPLPMDETTRLLSMNLQEIAENLHKDIKSRTGEEIAFTLLVFTEGRSQYISTTDRETSLRQIKTMIEYWERDLPDMPAHEIN